MDKELIETLKARAPILQEEGEVPQGILEYAMVELDKAIHLRDAHTVIIKLLGCPMGELPGIKINDLEPLYIKYLAERIVEHRIKKGV